MDFNIGIRREDKNQWEKRVPLIPEHVKKLKEIHCIQTNIQPSKLRIFHDKEYKKIGAIVKEDLSECNTVFAVKEIPIDFFESNKTYIFFSHTIKGQKYNMPMLKKMMDLNCTLIDYEKIVDKYGNRLVFFGRFAGIAGMVDTLWAFGQKLKSRNIDTPFNEIKQTINYSNLNEIKNHFEIIGERIQKNGLPKSISPIIIGIAGYGNVSKGVQEILDFLPIKNIAPEGIVNGIEYPATKYIYKVVFKEKDMVEPIESSHKFVLQDYYNHPEKYISIFEKFVPNLSILMNCIYWDSRYPRLITKKFVTNNYNDNWKLKIIGDISIDINGAIEFTEKVTTPDNPVFIYNPCTDNIKDGYIGDGIMVMGVDNLPCELPLESSISFSKALHSFVPSIVKADFKVEFKNCDFPHEIKKGVILYNGSLTPDYKYINKYL
jgi:alpha-aminoadipic semialdehyde synthase